MSQWTENRVSDAQTGEQHSGPPLPTPAVLTQHPMAVQHLGYSYPSVTASSTTQTQGQFFYSQAFPSYSNTYGVPYPPHPFVNYQAPEQHIQSVIQQYGSHENYLAYVSAYQQYYEQQRQLQQQQQYYAYHMQQQGMQHAPLAVAPPLPPPPVPPPPLPPSPPQDFIPPLPTNDAPSSVYSSLDTALNKQYTKQLFVEGKNKISEEDMIVKSNKTEYAGSFIGDRSPMSISQSSVSSMDESNELESRGTGVLVMDKISIPIQKQRKTRFSPMGVIQANNVATLPFNMALKSKPDKRPSRFSVLDVKSESINSESFICEKGRGKVGGLDNDSLIMLHQQRAQRAKRFDIDKMKQASRTNSSSQIEHSKNIPSSEGSGVALHLDDMHTVQGTSTNLEKEYFRLTSAPDPSTVRPLYILQEALQRLLSLWQRRGNIDIVTGTPIKADYIYMCSQLKAIRQDITVQCIRGPFAVKVYESHARIALEEDDLNEYNQCQTQLKELYSSGEEGALVEFSAYRILYHVVLQMNHKYKGGSADMLQILSEIPENMKNEPSILHALRVREAVSTYSYNTFFRLLKNAPNLGSKIMSNLVSYMRLKALERIVKTYRPTVGTSFVLRTVGLEDDSSGKQYLLRCGVVLSVDGSEVQCKESSIQASIVMSGNTLL